MSDLSMRQHVLDELEFEPSVNAAHIGVAAENGVVSLTGHVKTYLEKVNAIAATRRIKGVRAVADEIEVRFEPGQTASDDQLAKRALDSLDWDSAIPKNVIQLTVRDGWITLSGNVDWYYQKNTAENNVRRLTGVRGVINTIQILPHARAEDVKAKIVNALKRHAELEAKTIRVTVQNNDKVILDGKVDNWDEVCAVKNAAWSAAGVKSVEDRLSIS